MNSIPRIKVEGVKKERKNELSLANNVQLKLTVIFPLSLVQKWSKITDKNCNVIRTNSAMNRITI